MLKLVSTYSIVQNVRPVFCSTEQLESSILVSVKSTINNRTVKFVASCCVVFKHVEVSTILVSVKSAGSWLHAGTCLVFVRGVVLEIFGTLQLFSSLWYTYIHMYISVLS